ncbi:MAG: tRNA pseudouridine(55) synthase TruB [Schleiferiaceae bacterium]
MDGSGLSLPADLEGAQAGFWVAVDKPLTWTSFDVVAKVRNALKRRYGARVKIGHAGTLDPLATGLLVLAVGRKTKEIEAVMAGAKTYVATLKLGAVTDSCDAETPEKPTGAPVPELTAELEAELRAQFTGVVQQVPPLFSAVKVDGARAYDLARSGKTAELSARPVTIESLEFEALDAAHWQLRIRCGKGTYIRSLARDLGDYLGCGAYLTQLRRTEVAPFTEMHSVDAVLAAIQSS